jgi:hypothetical protein
VNDEVEGVRRETVGTYFRHYRNIYSERLNKNNGVPQNNLFTVRDSKWAPQEFKSAVTIA